MANRKCFLYSLLICGCGLISLGNAGYTSEETEEKSKSLYNAVTSILASDESSKYHRKHSYEPSAPCGNVERCPIAGPGQIQQLPLPSGTPTPCGNVAGCPLQKSTSIDTRIVYPTPVPSHVTGYMPSSYGNANNGYSGFPSQSSAGLANPPAAAANGNVHFNSGYHAPVPTGIAYPPPPPASNYYNANYGVQPQVPPQGYAYSGAANTYPLAQPNPSGYYGYPAQPVPTSSGYQGERGYSVLNHSLKTKSEYNEVGTHNGPLQQAPNGYGYGSGYGGYMGMYNRPGF